MSSQYVEPPSYKGKEAVRSKLSRINCEIRQTEKYSYGNGLHKLEELKAESVKLAELISTINEIEKEETYLEAKNRLEGMPRFSRGHFETIVASNAWEPIEHGIDVRALNSAHAHLLVNTDIRSGVYFLTELGAVALEISRKSM